MQLIKLMTFQYMLKHLLEGTWTDKYLYHTVFIFYLFILVHSIHQTWGHSPEDIEHVTVV